MLNSVEPFEGFKEFGNQAREFIFSAMQAIDFKYQPLENELMFTRDQECLLFRRGKSPIDSLCVLAIPLFKVVGTADLGAVVIFLLAGYDSLVQTANSASYALNPLTQYLELIVQFNLQDDTPESLRDATCVYLDLASELRAEHRNQINADDRFDDGPLSGAV
jgi:hypothetical protein